MKAKSFLVVIFTLTAGTLLSQDTPEKIKVKNSEYWNLSYSLGGVYDINNNTAQSKRYNVFGYSYNFDISYTPMSAVGFFANYSYSNVALNNNSAATYPQSKPFLSIVIGARIYNTKKNLFADLGSGISSVGLGDKTGLDLAAGAGGKIKIMDGYNVILKGSLHTSLFGEPDDKSNLFLELSGGLELNNSKTLNVKAVKGTSRYSVSLLYNLINDSEYPGSFGFEAVYNEDERMALVVNYLYGTRNLYAYNYSTTQHVGTFSPRFYFGNQSTKLFLETGASLALWKDIVINQNTMTISQKQNNLLCGFNVGTGAELGLLKNISAIVKTNAVIFLGSSESFVSYSGGLKYSF